MLLSLVKNLFHPRVPKSTDVFPRPSTAPLRLHIGGQISHPDWEILDVRPGALVDYVGHCTDLSAFADASIVEIYASHVIEHLAYQRELGLALSEFHRVLVPGGYVRISVPDLPTLCSLYLDPALNFDERFHVLRMIFGGQVNRDDFHYLGFNEELLTSCLQKSGFSDISRIDDFGLFDDCSSLIFRNKPISLNVCARKPTTK